MITKADMMYGFAFFIAVVLFMAVVMPIALDREIERQEAVAAWTWQHYGQYMED